MLTVEDGTGLGDADSFISLADATAYHAARGNAAWTAEGVTDDLREQALRRATSFLSASFPWAGYRVRGRDQALAWPRYGVSDVEGWAVPSDAVPREVRDATAEVALRELAAPGSMTPDVVLSERIKSEQVGPIRTEYFGSTSVDEVRPTLLIVRDLVGGLLARWGGSALVGTSYRV
jgi:hypothetical protein